MEKDKNGLMAKLFMNEQTGATMTKKKQPQQPMPRREYKFDIAMQEAAKRARAQQPALISMVSNVKEFDYAKR